MTGFTQLCDAIERLGLLTAELVDYSALAQLVQDRGLAARRVLRGVA
jgi:hypothetical protein